MTIWMNGYVDGIAVMAPIGDGCESICSMGAGLTRTLERKDPAGRQASGQIASGCMLRVIEVLYAPLLV